MKKIFTLGTVLGIIILAANTSFAYNSYLDVPNAGNANFKLLTQQQFEKNETLDFIDEPEQYKSKREQKDRYLDYQEGKVDIPKSYSLNGGSSRPGSNNVQFTRDENGHIIIRNSN